MNDQRLNARCDFVDWALAQLFGAEAFGGLMRNLLGGGPTCVCLFGLMFLPGCQTAQEDKLPTLAEIAPSAERFGVDAEEQKQAQMFKDWRTQFEIGQVTVALDEPTQRAWALSQTQWLDPVVSRLWQDNGLIAGLVASDQWQTFEAALPPVLSRGVKRVRSAGEWQVLAEYRLQPSATGEGLTVVLDRGEQDGGRSRRHVLGSTKEPEKSRQIDRGRLRLLLQARPSIDGGLFVGLWLQQHIPDRLGMVREQDGLMRPMTMHEKFETGWFMHQLTQEVPVPRGQALVVGLHRPWAYVPSTDRDAEAWPLAISAMGVVCGPLYSEHYVIPDRAFHKLSAPVLKPQLGTFLMLEKVANQPAQRLFVIAPTLP